MMGERFISTNNKKFINPDQIIAIDETYRDYTNGYVILTFAHGAEVKLSPEEYDSIRSRLFSLTPPRPRLLRPRRRKPSKPKPAQSS